MMDSFSCLFLNCFYWYSATYELSSSIFCISRVRYRLYSSSLSCSWVTGLLLACSIYTPPSLNYSSVIIIQYNHITKPSQLTIYSYNYAHLQTHLQTVHLLRRTGHRRRARRLWSSIRSSQNGHQHFPSHPKLSNHRRNVMQCTIYSIQPSMGGVGKGHLIR